MISTIIKSHGFTYGVISGVVKCPHCPREFEWGEAKAGNISDREGHEKELDLKIFGPACPSCSRIVPLGRFNLPVEDLRQLAHVAAQKHKPPRQKGAAVSVWGQRAGLLVAMSFPGSMPDDLCGQRADEFLVSQGWPSRNGATWIRTAVGGEATARDGQWGERIMVHWDGARLNWSPVLDWITVAPMGLLDDE